LRFSYTFFSQDKKAIDRIVNGGPLGMWNLLCMYPRRHE